MDQVTAVVDFGTSHTVVVVAGPGGPARLVPVDGEPRFPSAVFLDRDGHGVTGRDALRLGESDPARLVRYPKAHLGQDTVPLGNAEVPTPVLVRTVLVRAIAEAVRCAHAVVAHLVLTHPAGWGPDRLGTLLTAARGLVPRVSTMAGPVAAAAWFAVRHNLPVGATLAVLDLDRGGCDAALVRHEPAGLVLTASAALPGLADDDPDQLVRAAELLDSTVRSAGLTTADLAGVQLAGGSSQVPLLAEGLRGRTDVPVRLDERPEAVLALGAGAAYRAGAAGDPDTTGPVRISGPGPAAPAPPAEPARSLGTVAAVAILAAAVLGLAALVDIRGFGGTVAGTAQSSVPRLSLPAAAPGSPVTVSGRSTGDLPEARPGQFVDYVHEAATLRWRLDSFDDSEEIHRGIARLGNELDPGYHWALVRYTVVAVGALAEEPDLGDRTYLVDDRGLMISRLDGVKDRASAWKARLPDYCAPPGTGPVAGGAQLARCALFAVPDATPVTKVALAPHANANPLPARDEQATGAWVAVPGRDTAGAEPARPGRPRAPGAAVSTRIGRSSVDIAVMGLVENPSAYLTEDTTIVLGGSRAMVLRTAVRLAEPVPATSLTGLSFELLDDRGARIDAATSLAGNECVDTGSSARVSGTVALCVLFAVPAQAAPRSAVVRTTGRTAPAVWRLR